MTKYQKLAWQFIKEKFGTDSHILNDNAYTKFAEWLDEQDSLEESKPQGYAIAGANGNVLPGSKPPELCKHDIVERERRWVCIECKQVLPNLPKPKPSKEPIELLGNVDPAITNVSYRPGAFTEIRDKINELIKAHNENLR